MNDAEYTGCDTERNPSFYLELSNEYGWKLYSYLQKKIKDHKVLSSVYEKAMLDFYKCAMERCPDNMEEMLYNIADRAYNAGTAASAASAGRRKQEKTEDARQTLGRKKQQGGFGFWLIFMLLLLLNMFCLWVIVGLLMDMGIITEIDLGFSWFDENIVRWFR